MATNYDYWYKDNDKRVWNIKLSRFIAVAIILIVGILVVTIYVNFFMTQQIKEKATSLVSNVTGVFSADTEKAEATAEDTAVKKKKEKDSSFIFKKSSKKKLKDSQLKKLSKKKLQIAEYEIYARNGRGFKSKKWQKYFDKKSWYEHLVSPGFFDKHKKSLLNKIEKANIKKIKKYLKKKSKAKKKK